MNEPLNTPPWTGVNDMLLEGGGQVLASRGRRLAGFLIDGVIGILATYLVIVLGLGGLASLGEPFGSVIRTLIGCVLFLLIFGWPLITRGQTLGKVILGMRIVHPDGSRVKALPLIGLRYGLPSLIFLIPFVGFVFAILDCLWIFNRHHRCLHDLLANTIVIKV